MLVVEEATEIVDLASAPDIRAYIVPQQHEARSPASRPFRKELPMWKDFRAFIMRGNVIDLAIGVIIGIAFGAVVKSLVDDVIMPPIGLATGGIDFSNKFVVLKDGAAAAGPYVSVAAAKAAGATTLNYGIFVNNVVSFLIVAFCAFLLVRAVNRLMHPHGDTVVPKLKPCPYCAMDIPIAATRCPLCTSQLVAA
jgi:large conductance mechanosensitive channel